jgi:hypothetical protein
MTIKEQIEQLEEKANREIPEDIDCHHQFDYQRGEGEVAKQALAIIKKQEERIVNFKDLAYSISLLRAYFPKLKQELYNEIDAGQSGVAEMIRSDELQNNILHQIEKANKLLFLEENA